MGMRGFRILALMGSMGVSLTVACLPVHAADGETAEAAEVTAADVSHEHILQTIEATRQTDPELAAEMERQFDLYESGRMEASELSGRDLAVGAPPESGEGRSDPRLVGPPVEAGRSGADQAVFEQVQSDPRMQETRRQFEAGEITEGQAREQVSGVLRDHGIEPNNGREWEGAGMGGESGREQGEGGFSREFHNEGRFDTEGRGYEHMSPEAREQMERFFGPEGDADRASFERDSTMQEEGPEGAERDFGRMMEREFGGSERSMEYERSMEGMERSFEGPMREFESQTREFESPERSFESAGREYEAPTREYEAPTREYEAPTREYEAPERMTESPEREYESPTREYEAPTREYEAPTREYESPERSMESPERSMESPERTYEMPERDMMTPEGGSQP